MALPLLLSLLLAPAEDAPPEIPKVLLSKHHKQMCKVGVDDALPAVRLTNAGGQPVDLARLSGRRGTVVALFRGDSGQGDGWMTRQLRADLARDVAEPYSDRGINVVAIHVGGPADANAPYPTLGDPSGEAFAQVGSGRLPRVYVLGPAEADKPGKILWFDIEYSRSTRRELRQTLRALTGESVARRPSP